MKHAYLILAHAYTKVLEVLLSLLDDERNDVFLHMDKKNRETPPEWFGNFRHGGFYSFSKLDVSWGTPSLYRAELLLFKQALKKGGYSYYHLISGADLPIRSQDDIHAFFLEHAGKEFVHFGTPRYCEDIASRYKTYHFFEKQLGKSREDPFWNKTETYSQAIQRRLHIDRVRNSGIRFYGGSQWFSATEDFAGRLFEESMRLKRYWRFSQMPEEFMPQTILMASEYRDRLYLPGLTDDYRSCTRYIDWKRGNPYVFRKEDLPGLLSADACFARKFDDKIDDEIVKALSEALRVSA